VPPPGRTFLATPVGLAFVIAVEPIRQALPSNGLNETDPADFEQKRSSGTRGERFLLRYRPSQSFSGSPAPEMVLFGYGHTFQGGAGTNAR
jgi:hypothetical protein